jgi:S-DNA-T family DNA segregation ATPase FtsK/SpoIIIE
MGAITKGDGTLSGVFGNEIQDYLASIIGNFGLWVTLISAIALYFILEFNLRPSSIQENMMPSKTNLHQLILMQTKISKQIKN